MYYHRCLRLHEMYVPDTLVLITKTSSRSYSDFRFTPEFIASLTSFKPRKPLIGLPDSVLRNTCHHIGKALADQATQFAASGICKAI